MDLSTEKHANGEKAAGIGVAVLGASAKPERYSYKAVRMLSDMGYKVFPVHPALSVIDGIPVCRSLAEVPAGIDTITVYVSPERSTALRDDFFRAKPRRVIFNPGAENPGLAQALARAGVEVQNACTLVMLSTGQFAPSEPQGR